MREQFTFYRSFWEAAKQIKKPRDRLSYLEAVMAFALDGEDREVTDDALPIYILTKPTLISAAKKSEAGKIKSKANQNEIKTESNADQNANKIENKIKNKIESKGEIENECSPPKPPSRWTPPTVEEVKAYCDERHSTVDAEHFVAYYSSQGWKVGRNPMKDWKAAVRTWEQKDRERNAPRKIGQPGTQPTEERLTPIRAEIQANRDFLQHLREA